MALQFAREAPLDRNQEEQVPKIASFYGIDIYIYYLDHNPPHFHVRFSGLKAIVNINSGKITKSELPSRAERLVSEWHVLNRAQLLDNWEQSRRGEPLTPIKPLL